MNKLLLINGSDDAIHQMVAQTIYQAVKKAGGTTASGIESAEEFRHGVKKNRASFIAATREFYPKVFDNELLRELGIRFNRRGNSCRVIIGGCSYRILTAPQNMQLDNNYELPLHLPTETASYALFETDAVEHFFAVHLPTKRGDLSGLSIGLGKCVKGNPDWNSVEPIETNLVVDQVHETDIVDDFESTVNRMKVRTDETRENKHDNENGGTATSRTA
ncbi:hypothetical protein ACIP5Z_01505 [Rothia terrae]|uniref:hypothetical protein n=1 Tax=Rothia terrae TaxID=396015 RepID=UPI00382D9E35